MMAAALNSQPMGAALFAKARRALDIVLHIGAHRTATTSLQRLARDHVAGLAGQGVTFWGPQVTRPNLLPGVQPGRGRSAAMTRRAAGRLRLKCAQAGLGGTQVLILSDENMLGTPQGNLTAQALYPAAGERLARISAALRGQVRRVVLSVRGQEAYWSSVLAMMVERGHNVPRARVLQALADARRGWRDVVTDVACAVPEAELIILPHESTAGLPEWRLQVMAGRPLPVSAGRIWAHRAPDLTALRRHLAARGQNPAILPMGEGRWTPFTAGQSAALRETYADDLHWMTAGADGLAQLKTWTAPGKTGQTPHSGTKTRGHDHEQQGRMA